MDKHMEKIKYGAENYFVSTSTNIAHLSIMMQIFI